MGMGQRMVHRWVARGVVVLVAVFVALTLINAIINGGQGAWLTVASVASLLVVLLTFGPERFR